MGPVLLLDAPRLQLWHGLHTELPSSSVEAVESLSTMLKLEGTLEVESPNTTSELEGNLRVMA